MDTQSLHHHQTLTNKQISSLNPEPHCPIQKYILQKIFSVFFSLKDIILEVCQKVCECRMRSNCLTAWILHCVHGSTHNMSCQPQLRAWFPVSQCPAPLSCVPATRQAALVSILPPIDTDFTFTSSTSAAFTNTSTDKLHSTSQPSSVIN